MHRGICCVVLSVLLLGLCSSVVMAAGPGDDPVPYFIGLAVGEEAQQDQARSGVDWTLKIIFADEKTREYLSDVDLEIFDSLGERVLMLLCDGPWIVIALPAGEYTVRGSYAGTLKERKVKVPGSTMRTEYMFW